MSCPKRDVEIVLGCRNGVPVYLEKRYFDDGSHDVLGDIYSDGLGPTGRTPGECSATEYDYEKLVMCEVGTGLKVLIESRVDVADPTQTRTTRYTYIATNTTFTGNPDTDLSDCGSEKLDIQTKQYCDNGETVFGTLVFDVSAGGANPPLLGIVFHKIDATVHTPTAPVEGACGLTNRQINVIEDCAGATTATDVAGEVAKEVILSGSTKTIPVRLVEDCALPQVVAIPNCDGTTTNQNVDEVNAVRLLNQENKHTEVVSDVLTAVFSGTVVFNYTAPTNVAISYASVTLSNDTVVAYRTDFGDGYNDVGPSPSHSYNADGEYEIKGYAITLSGNKLLLYAKEVTIASGVITYSGTNPHTVARTYKVLVAKAFQDYCGATLVGTPYNADGSAYVLVGDFEVATPIIIDELEDNADYQARAVCKKEIFATHIKRIATPGVPANSVAYEMSMTLAAFYQGPNNATNTYIHCIYPVQNGALLTPIGPQLTEYFGNPQNGVLFTDVATVQAMTDNVLLQMGLSVGDAVYAVNTDNEPIWFLSPAAVAVLGDPTFLHIYYGTSDAHNVYDQKADVTVLAANPSVLLGGANTGSCTPIQEIKEKDSCTGLETYRYIVEDGAGNLVPVTDVYPAFVEADVLHEPCVAPSVVETAGGTLVTAGNTFTIPANTVSFTVSAQTGSFDVSFDGGATYTLTGRKGTRTRGQGTIETISNSSNIVVLSNGDIDIIRETI
ncbi:MAG TPA: hypothetical protein PLW93_01335 [Candidatus Absconditabacterales bacterium]|nr:hypothetical protein [Candidatus Absconditabacterales bacterium]